MNIKSIIQEIKENSRFEIKGNAQFSPSIGKNWLGGKIKDPIDPIKYNSEFLFRDNKKLSTQFTARKGIPKQTLLIK